MNGTVCGMFTNTGPRRWDILKYRQGAHDLKVFLTLAEPVHKCNATKSIYIYIYIIYIYTGLFKNNGCTGIPGLEGKPFSKTSIVRVYPSGEPILGVCVFLRGVKWVEFMRTWQAYHVSLSLGQSAKNGTWTYQSTVIWLVLCRNPFQEYGSGIRDHHPSSRRKNQKSETTNPGVIKRKLLKFWNQKIQNSTELCPWKLQRICLNTTQWLSERRWPYFKNCSQLNSKSSWDGSMVGPFANRRR